MNASRFLKNTDVNNSKQYFLCSEFSINSIWCLDTFVHQAWKLLETLEDMYYPNKIMKRCSENTKPYWNEFRWHNRKLSWSHFIYLRILRTYEILIKCYIKLVKTNQFNKDGETEFILYIELRYQLISYIQVSFLIRLRKP